MGTQAAETTTMETMHSLFHDMPTLSNDGLRKLADEAKIEDLKAKYGTIPNAETIAALKELEDGGGEVVTIDQIMAELNADDSRV